MDDTETEKNSLPNGSAGRQVTRSYPQAIVILCILVSLTNPFLAPTVIYFILRSRRSWSKCQYSMTYRHVNKAAGLTIVGIIVTGIALVTVVLFCVIIPINNNTPNTPKTAAENVTETVATVMTDTPEMVVRELQDIKIDLNTTDADKVEHLENVPGIVAGPHVTKHYLNDTHVLIIDGRTNAEKILNVPKLF
ncbi:uncharacterized protein LOC123529869 [Mercenaria mercenaria]|uniref:uncharacterized protein LOC123529869 n=1 Tax=Mercenaria mercenaria TaxID=6596 RepID=UPI00234EF8CC|nr:uncharacterized protein LOC123529869 [Mercenaria mercenaria]